MVWIPAGDHRVPGTLAMPALTPGQTVPAVLLLHGDFSDRDEGGDMFGRLAASLSDRGIASLRIDFAGSGDSEEPDLSLDYPGMVLDATASLTYLEQQPSLDPAELAVLGLSRGGSIAATVAGTVPGVAALVSWSGAIANAYEDDPDGHQQAREDGEVVIDLGDRDFHVSLAWYDTILDSHPLDDVAGFTNPVLAVVGSDDDVVPPEISDIFLDTVASTDKTLHTIEGGDHGFTAEQEYGDEAIAVTTDWLASRLGLSPAG
ncbi:MAG: alpha/beta fold hydrolase [Nakamurella sp.]